MTITYTGDIAAAFTNFLTGPSPGEYVTSLGVGVYLQQSINQMSHLNEKKVAKAGDTMTGTLVVNGTPATNNPGVTSTGVGTGPGLVGGGGTSSGTGVVGIGGTTNGKGADFLGTGVKCASGTGRGLDVGAGNMVFTGTSPAATADPGANNYQAGANIVHVRATVQSNGVGGTLLGGFGVNTLSADANGLTVTFHRPFASATEFTAVVSNDSANPWWATISARSTTSVTIRWILHDGTVKDPTSETLNASLIVSGRQ